MLATLTDERFSSLAWIYERKLDGERCLAFRRHNRVRLLSRNRKDLADTYPELVDALAKRLPKHSIVDGEIVTFKGKITSFSRIQQRIGITDPRSARDSGINVYLYLFDLLYLESYDVTHLPLRTRKGLLCECMSFGDPLRYTAHRNESGEDCYAQACDKGWEGIIAKRADSRYQHSRSRDWLKFKCLNRQEFVTGGYTNPRGSRSGFGALILGYYDGDELCYAGKVGSGFSQDMLDSLNSRLRARKRKTCPFARLPSGDRDRRHWVTPKLVAEVAFTEWTRRGRLRHPRFVGLREDKPARDVVREEPL